MKKLELGAGKKPTEGYEHLDIMPGEDIEFVADARKLPFSKNSWDEIKAKWLLEHFAGYEIVDVLKEWKRVLKPGGKLIISTNYQARINECLAEGSINWDEWVYLTYGHVEPESLQWDIHKIGFNRETIDEYMKEAKFSRVEIKEIPKPFNTVPISSFLT